MPTFDHSTWLAKRVLDAKRLGPPTAPTQVALPGVQQAVPVDRLHALQASGMGEREIVHHTNARWREANAERLDAHRGWVKRYDSAIEGMRRQAAERAAEELRRRSIFEKFMAEHAEAAEEQ